MSEAVAAPVSTPRTCKQDAKLEALAARAKKEPARLSASPDQVMSSEDEEETEEAKLSETSRRWPPLPRSLAAGAAYRMHDHLGFEKPQDFRSTLLTSDSEPDVRFSRSSW